MKSLYPVQKTSRDRLLKALSDHRAALDASETGTGKTVVGASIASKLAVPTLVICPKIVVPSWQKELEEQGIKPLAVINYEKLRTGKTPWGAWDGKHWKWNIPEDTLLIWDEVHKCQGTTTKNAKMLLAAKPHLNLCCSATAAEDPTEMRALGYILGLHAGGNFWTWAMRNGCLRNRWGGFEFRGSPESLKKIADQIFPEKGSRVTKTMLADHFCETQIITSPLDIDDGIGKLYEEMEQELAELELKSSGDKKGHQHEKLTLMLRARQKIELLKIPVFVELAEDLLREGHSVVIFVNFDATAEALRERLDVGGIIRGGQTAEEREAIVRAFQENKTRVVVANIAAGGVGVSLHDQVGGHPRAAIISPSWNAKDLIQTLGRVHRAGGKTPSLQRVVFAANSIEEEIERATRKKLEQIKILNPDENTLNESAPKVSHLTLRCLGIPYLQQPTQPQPNLRSQSSMSSSPTQEPSSRPHAKFSPSSLKYFEQCPSYRNRPDTNAIAERGNRIHEALETGDFSKLQDEDERTVASLCHSFVVDLLESKGWRFPNLRRINELKVDIDLGGGVSTFGTCDVLAMRDKEALLIDFKTGWGKIDDAETNAQAQAYVLGAFQKFPELEKIEFYFVIPHRDEVSVGTYTRQDIDRIKLRFNTVIRRAEAAQNNELPYEQAYNPALALCEYCGHQAKCQKLADKMLMLARKHEPAFELPENVQGSQNNDPSILSNMLKLVPIVEAWASGIRKRCIDLAVQEGVNFPDFKRVERRAARSITSALGAFEAVKDEVPLEDFLAVCDKVSISKLEEQFAKNAPKGKKGNSKQLLECRLKDAGILKEEQGFIYLKQIK